MDNYVKLCTGIIVPKVWIDTCKREDLLWKTHEKVATYYLDMSDIPIPIEMDLTPKAVLVVIEENHWFLLDAEAERFNNQESAGLQRESLRWVREQKWLDIPISDKADPYPSELEPNKYYESEVSFINFNGFLKFYFQFFSF